MAAKISELIPSKLYNVTCDDHDERFICTHGTESAAIDCVNAHDWENAHGEFEVLR